MQETKPPDIAAWPDEYESILRFYFWEPQHLNRFAPPPDRRLGVEEVFARLRKREVPLNHLFSIFFSLAPAAMSARLLSAVAPSIKGSSAYLLNSLSLRYLKPFSACQPDLLLMLDGRPVFWELKLRSRTSNEQLWKYALLGESLTSGRAIVPALILVGRNTDSSATDTFEKQRAGASLEIPPGVRQHATRIGIMPERLLTSAQQMSISRATYSEISNHLQSELESVNAQPESGETLSRLLRGMIHTLERVLFDQHPAQGSGIRRTITSERYFEELEARFQGITEKLNAFVAELASYDISPEFGADSMILRWRPDDTKSWNFGAISKSGDVWTQFTTGQACALGLVEVGKQYLRNLAALVPDAAVKITPKPAGWFVVYKGRNIQVDMLLAEDSRRDGWIRAIREFQQAVMKPSPDWLLNDSTMCREIILEVGAEGGSLTIVRVRNVDGGWQFRVEKNEAALCDLLSEEDGDEIERQSADVECHSFHDALAIFDRYQWFHLHPLKVHPEFHEATLIEVKKRGGGTAEMRWRDELKRREALQLVR